MFWALKSCHWFSCLFLKYNTKYLPNRMIMLMFQFEFKMHFQKHFLCHLWAMWVPDVLEMTGFPASQSCKWGYIWGLWLNWDPFIAESIRSLHKVRSLGYFGCFCVCATTRGPCICLSALKWHDDVFMTQNKYLNGQFCFLEMHLIHSPSLLWKLSFPSQPPHVIILINLHRCYLISQ